MTMAGKTWTLEEVHNSTSWGFDTSHRCLGPFSGSVTENLEVGAL